MEGPFGSFFLREDSDKPIVLLASGAGFAPSKPCWSTCSSRGITRPTTLYWGGRRLRDLYMHQWVVELAAQMPQLRYVPVVSDALPGRPVGGAAPALCPGRAGRLCRPLGPPGLRLRRTHRGGIGTHGHTAQQGLPAEEFFADSHLEADKHGPQA